MNELMHSFGSMGSSSLPPRFRESAFRSYESMILEVVRKFPLVTQIDPTPLAPVTFACRFRDAMASLIANNWETEIDKVLLHRIYNKIIVSEGMHGKIEIGSREELAALRQVTKGTVETPELKTIAIPDLRCLQALCLLLHNRILVGPYHIDCTAILPAVDPKDLTDIFDISVTQSTAPNLYTIL